MTQYDRRFGRGQENRMSSESHMIFESLATEKLFDGDELLDAFQNSNSGNSNASMTSIPPVQFVNATATKRSSAKEFDGSSSGMFFYGKDLMDIFKTDQDTSMGMPSSHSYRRRSSTTGNDRRGSLMSLTDGSILDNPMELEDILDAVSMPVMNNPSEQRTAENTMNNNNSNNGNSNSNINKDCDNNEEGDDRIEYIQKIGPYDIICGRNNGAHDWIGNRRFRITIMMNLKRYTEAPGREEKTHVIKSVIELMLDTKGVGARFIKKVGDGMYVRLNGKQIREKVGHAFRDMISLAEQEGGKLEAKCFW
jgi:hypothetical protein